jgi:hypothetical protein
LSRAMALRVWCWKVAEARWMSDAKAAVADHDPTNNAKQPQVRHCLSLPDHGWCATSLLHLTNQHIMRDLVAIIYGARVRK